MNIVVVGCGRVGAELAHRLYQHGHQVAIVDHVGAAFDNLSPDFRGRTVEGEVMNQDVLRRAGIEQADALAAVTNSDSLNAVIAHLARTLYHVGTVVVRNYDPSWRPMHEAFGLQVVSSTSWGAQRIEAMLYHGELRSVFSAGNGEVEVYELLVPQGWQGRDLAELLAGSQCLPVALTRAGQASLPALDTPLEAGDIVHVSATLEGIDSLRERLEQPEEV
jgi:trk system potassium uptake protein TrkA